MSGEIFLVGAAISLGIMIYGLVQSKRQIEQERQTLERFSFSGEARLLGEVNTAHANTFKERVREILGKQNSISKAYLMFVDLAERDRDAIFLFLYKTGNQELGNEILIIIQEIQALGDLVPKGLLIEVGFEGGDQERDVQSQGEPFFRQDELKPAEPAIDLDFDTSRKTLGLSQFFSEEEFKAAYRSKMLSSHPDSGGSHATAQAVNWARDIIKDRRGWS